MHINLQFHSGRGCFQQEHKFFQFSLFRYFSERLKCRMCQSVSIFINEVSTVIIVILRHSKLVFLNAVISENFSRSGTAPRSPILAELFTIQADGH